MSRVWVLCLLLLGLSSTPASAQDWRLVTPSELSAGRERLSALMDSLETVYTVRHGELIAITSGQQNAMLAADPVDTARIGTFTFIGPRSAINRARPEFETAISYYRGLLGTAESQLPNTIFLLWDSEYGPYKGWYAPEDSSRVVHVNFDRNIHAEFEQFEAYRYVGRQVVLALPVAVRLWLGRDLIPQDQDRLTYIYSQLATTGLGVVRRCHRKEAVACIVSFGLTRSGEDWLTWYTPHELRSYAVTGRGSGALRRAFEAGNVSANTCMRGRWVALRDSAFSKELIREIESACVDFLRSENKPAPERLGPIARQEFLLRTAEQGGPGALGRIVGQDSIAIAEALEEVAGRPLTDVVREWRDEVELARPKVRAETGKAVAAGMFWSIVIGFLALRSTRWRVG